MFFSSHFSLAAAAILTVGTSAGRADPDMAKSEYAIQWTGLSKACQGALASLVDSKSDISQCSRVGKLFNEVVSKSAVNPDQSLVPPLQLWLEDELCAKAPCDAATITAAYTAIADQCSKEVEKGRLIPMIAQAALLNYEVGRQTLCLKDSGARDNSTSYCAAEVLGNIEASGTPITYKQGQLAIDDIEGMTSVDAVPAWTYCQPCAQGLMAPVINALTTIQPGLSESLQSVVDGRCGAGFANGEVPASLEDGITYSPPEEGNGSEGGKGDTDEPTGDKDAGFRVQPFVNSATLLLLVAMLVAIGL